MPGTQDPARGSQPQGAHDTDRIYQRIGEFIVSFQCLEQCFREIGWLLMDPHRRTWPPTALRGLTNHGLLNRVRSVYVEVVSTLPGSGIPEYCASFSYVVDKAHEARRARNKLLHSAFVELKAGGEVHGVMRADPLLVVDENGEFRVDAEILSDENLVQLILSLGPLTVAANMHLKQLIHWSPFVDRPPLDDCGLPFHVRGLPLENDRTL